MVSSLSAKDVISYMESLYDERQRQNLMRFFKTGPGQYGEGDEFLGLKVPQTREVVRHAADLPLREIPRLLMSRWHEVRLCGFLLLVNRFERLAVKRLINDEQAVHQRDELVKMYLDYADQANNWDLVDVITWRILGMWALEHHDEKIFHKLAKSKNLWERRIAIVSYMAFYRHGVIGDGAEIIEQLLGDKEDLIRKACGWMLREIYWRVDEHFVESFIIDHYDQMSRTTLRYAIERMPETQRKQFLKGEF